MPPFPAKYLRHKNLSKISIKTLKTTTVSVTAYTSSKFTLPFPCHSIVPRDIFGKHITSAATPDFHARPKAFTHDVTSVGMIYGNFTEKTFFADEILNTSAISKSFLSVLHNPSCTVCQISGKTIRQTMIIGRVELSKNRYSRIIIATTGTARIIFRIGDSNEYNRFEICVNTPKTNPRIQPIKNPIKIRANVSSSALINGAVKAISVHFLKTENGLGRISSNNSLSRLTRREAASQTRIQKVAISIAFIIFTKKDVLVCFVVEIISG